MDFVKLTKETGENQLERGTNDSSRYYSVNIKHGETTVTIRFD